MSNCNHTVFGLLTTKFVWVGGNLYAVCRLCGAELRQRADPATASNPKLN